MIEKSLSNTFESSSKIGHIALIIRKEAVKNIFLDILVFIEKYSNNSQIFLLLFLLICHLICIIGDKVAGEVPIGVNQVHFQIKVFSIDGMF